MSLVAHFPSHLSPIWLETNVAVANCRFFYHQFLSAVGVLEQDCRYIF